MGAIYSGRMPLVSISAAKHLLRLRAPTTAAMKLLRASISAARGAAANALSNELVAQLVETSTDGTETALFTPRKWSAWYVDYTTDFGAYNFTADGTEGDILWEEGFNLLNGFLWTPSPPREEITIAPGERLAINLDTAPGAASLLSAMMVVELIG